MRTGHDGLPQGMGGEVAHQNYLLSGIRLELIPPRAAHPEMSLQNQQGFPCSAGNRANGDCRAPAACK